MRTHVLGAALDAIQELLAERPGRLLVGITGPPAAGKSTLAAALAEALSTMDGMRAVAVPMDGFHLANAELARLGLTGRKGAPETFDAAGFVHLLRRLREPDGSIVYAPTFDRQLNESIGSVIPVFPDIRVVLIEGNYLLLDRPAWRPVRPLLDLTLYIDAPPAVRHDALVRRQLARGLTRPAAQSWADASDAANARMS
jgi:pantothenate kinase